MDRCEKLSLELIKNALPSCAEPGMDDRRHKRMLAALKKAADGELTDRQKECIFLYYGDKKSVKEIAVQLSIRPPTVSQHLKKAKKHLRRVMEYYFFDAKF